MTFGQDLPALSIPGISLRPIVEGDYTFLRALYRSVRDAELAVTGWPEEAKQAFCDSQFHLQDTWYRGQYDGAHFLLIERATTPIGRIYVHAAENELRLMDIALVPEERGAGLGTRLVEWLLTWGRESGRDATLYVEAHNPARRLYARHGFADESVEGVYLKMRCKPPRRG